MSADFLALAVPGVQKLSPYVTGKPIEELARELGMDPAQIVKLASNENPLGPSPKALAAIQDALPELTRYPDGSGYALKQKLAARFAIDPAGITLGNGSNDIIDLVARAFLAPGLNAVFSAHAFAAYPISTQATGAESRVVPAINYGHDLDGLIAAMDANTRVAYIANPNNPTGTWFGPEELERFLSRVPAHVVVVLDEAYIEFVRDPQSVDGVKTYKANPNVVLLRTFSKAHGLANLRVGYSVAHPEITNNLRVIATPFAVSSVAQDAAIASLKHIDAVYERVDSLVSERERVVAALVEQGWKFPATQANFVWLPLGEKTAQFVERAEAKALSVRGFAGEGVRISIAESEANDRFIELCAQSLDLAQS